MIRRRVFTVRSVGPMDSPVQRQKTALSLSSLSSSSSKRKPNTTGPGCLYLPVRSTTVAAAAGGCYGNDWQPLAAISFCFDVCYISESRFTIWSLTLWRPLLPFVTSIKHPVPDRVKPSFVIFDIQALWISALSAIVSAGCRKLQTTA